MLTPNFQHPTCKGIWRGLAEARVRAVRAEAERWELCYFSPHVHETRTRKAGHHRTPRCNAAPLRRVGAVEAELESPRGDDRHERPLQLRRPDRAGGRDPRQVRA